MTFKVLEEFSVNEQLSLKLINDKTLIYVDNKLFLTCKKLIININVSDIEEFNDLASMDEIIEKKRLSDEHPFFIPPRVEFWGHCSNLQVWVENDYNPSLLHSNLAIPLLKKLIDIGDKLAKKVFKEEILKRLESGNKNVLISFFRVDYLEYFSQDELTYIYENFVNFFEASYELLDFLRPLSILEFSPASEYYKHLVKKLMLEGSYKERREIADKHSDVLMKEELIGFFQTFSQDHVDDIKEEEERFRLLGVLINDLMFIGETFDNETIAKNLLGKNEQDYLLDFFNNSKYPYIRKNFEADEVRRRYWEKKLYYHLFKGHVYSIELICEDNHKEFLNKIKILKNFPKLKNLTILFSRTKDYSFLKHELPLHLDNVKIYVLDDRFPYLSQVRIS